MTRVAMGGGDASVSPNDRSAYVAMPAAPPATTRYGIFSARTRRPSGAVHSLQRAPSRRSG